MAQTFRLFHGDSLEVLKRMVPGSVDAVVTDPPYGLAFMGKRWDYDVPSVELWRQVLRVLKPGGYLLSFGGTRTYHRMVVNIEDAGFDICDMVAWIYGQGFPKSHDIAKAIDKKAGHWRGRNGGISSDNNAMSGENYLRTEKGDPITQSASASAWDGWGTALKPAIEPICMAQKPISTSTIIGNILKHGTGAINIEQSRIKFSGPQDRAAAAAAAAAQSLRQKDKRSTVSFGCEGNKGSLAPYLDRLKEEDFGRWPANVLLGHAETCDEDACDLFECPIALLDQQTGMLKSGPNPKRRGGPGSRNALGEFAGQDECAAPRGADIGGPSRFFYCSKPSKRERNAGCEDMPTKATHRYGAGLGEGHNPEHPSLDANHHPTVKPVELIGYLARLIARPGAVVLDPFLGSGTHGVAALKNGFRFIGIERELQYFEIAKARVTAAGTGEPSKD